MSREAGKRASGNSDTKGVVGSALILVLVVALAGGAGLQGPPRLVVGESVGADFEALAQETWGRFLAVFWARRDCFGDVRLEAAYRLDSRAGYDPDTATAIVRVPGTLAMLQSGLIHEWAHHVEFQCEAHKEFRPAFLVAQGLPLDTPWRPAGAMTDVAASERAGIPSEQWAEATVQAILGSRPIPNGVRVSEAMVQVVRGWAAGD